MSHASATTRARPLLALAVGAALAFGAATGAAQQTPGQQGQQQQGPRPGGGGGGGGGLSPLDSIPVADTTGFTRIFDGTSWSGWDGDRTFWRIEDNSFVGESTPQNVVSRNTFLIWRGGTLRDFELKLEVRMNSTNSGIQVRSQELPEAGQWVLAGYQADMEFAGLYTGNIHDERGRSFLAQRGQVSIDTSPEARSRIIGRVDDPTELKGSININGWNQYHIIGRGNVLMVIYNGRLMSVFIDDDAQNRDLEGLLGFQMHTGPPMKVEYRNIFLKTVR